MAPIAQDRAVAYFCGWIWAQKSVRERMGLMLQLLAIVSERGLLMNKYKFDDIAVGMRALFTKEITLEMEKAFRDISGDNSPLYRDDDFAREAADGEFPQHVTFGMLAASFYSTMAGMYLPGKYGMIQSLDDVCFLKPVFVGDRLTIIGEVVGKDEGERLIRLKMIIGNQKNQLISKAKMQVKVFR